MAAMLSPKVCLQATVNQAACTCVYIYIYIYIHRVHTQKSIVVDKYSVPLEMNIFFNVLRVTLFISVYLCAASLDFRHHSYLRLDLRMLGPQKLPEPAAIHAEGTSYRMCLVIFTLGDVINIAVFRKLLPLDVSNAPLKSCGRNSEVMKLLVDDQDMLKPSRASARCIVHVPEMVLDQYWLIKCLPNSMVAG